MRLHPALHMALLGAALAVAVLAAHVGPAPFAAGAVAVLVLVAVAAHRWPLATLVGAALSTLANPVIVPRLLPGGLGSGPVGLSDVVLAVAATVIVVEGARSGRLARALRDPVTPLVVLFVVLAIVSAAVNRVPPEVAVLGIAMTIDAIAIYVVVRAVPIGRRSAAVAAGAVVAACLVLAVLGIAQALIHPSLLGFDAFTGSFGEGERITAFLGNPNPVAAVLGIGLPFVLFGGLSLRRPRDRWIARAALFLLVLALLLTFSRGAWLAVGIGAILGGLLLDWRAIPLLLVTVALAWGTVVVMPRGLAVPSATDGAPDDAGPPDLVDTTVDRIGNLGGEDARARFTSEGIPIILDNLLLGVGPGRYGGAAAKIIPSPVYEEYGARLYGFRTIHNFWQHLLGESGALGTAVFLTILAGLLIRLGRAARAAVGSTRVLLAGAAMVVLVTGVHGLAEMTYEGNLPALLVWLVLGIATVFAPVRPLLARSPA
jgi:putative inorganic carbon (HCO3(-)) transporter